MKRATKNLWFWIAIAALVVLLVVLLFTIQPWHENLTGMPRLINKGR